MDDDENNTRYLAVAKILKEQQNQYIITEELLQPIEETAYPVSSEERQRLSEYARSHPYQSEREKVLDYLLKRVTEIDHSGECMGGYQHECVREDCTTCTVEFVIKELRQKAGEP